MTFVDTNVLLDIVTGDSSWSSWSIAALDDASMEGALLINAVIYAELSTRYGRIEELDQFVDGAGLELVEFPRAALFLAAKVFDRYRSSGGTKTGVLPDFFIGAQASILQLPILTRDVRRYRTYFPTVRLISPATV
ncbi:type II toxin-antitoxin system VapC family toxin [Mesorhizobium sp. BAC0120]|uniref:type II toxin-antitoxin system VapC family toxin n=1 Tax=Mesorhizobium sp. BAC0120 TaxID=3090670 RepID=UPI00298D3CEF|nr:type II toxin-antitoxin system VapC family toxin [Mesorhizobium sp. BAC0120]MDW6021386.1 type II toxin-antitoxin system VapC family toxin [Mesorhizobium sp. BAC0120]